MTKREKLHCNVSNLSLRDRILFELNYLNPGPAEWQNMPGGGSLPLPIARRAVEKAIEFCEKRDGSLLKMQGAAE